MSAAVECSSERGGLAAAHLRGDPGSAASQGYLSPALGGDPTQQRMEDVSSLAPPPPASPAGSPRPLSFGRWFARRARPTEIVWLLADAVFTNVSHAARLGQGLYCDNAGQDLGATGGSSGSSFFPCGGGLWSKLLWSLSSGAVIDPVLRLRMWDYGNLFYTWGELVAVLIALLAPALYVRCRPALIGAISAAPIVGGWITLLLAPDAALRLSAVAYMAARRHRVGGIYLGWRSAALLRVLTSAQLVTGPVLWLLAVPALSPIDHRMPPRGSSGGGSEEGRRVAAHALLLFAAIVVLPYMLCRVWEARALRPEYGKYLRDWTRAAGGRHDTCGASSEGDAPGDVAGDAAEAGASSARGAAAGGDDYDDARSSASCSYTWVSHRSPGGAGSSSITSGGGNSGGGYRLMLRSDSVDAYRCGDEAAAGLSPAAVGSPAAAPVLPTLQPQAPVAAAPAPAAAAAGGSASDAGSSSRMRSALAAAVAEAAVSAFHASPRRAAAAATNGSIPTTAASGRFMGFTAAVEPQPAAAIGGLAARRPRSVLYRPAAAATAGASGGPGGRVSRTALVSIKVPVRHRGSDPGASSSPGRDEEPSHAEPPSFEEASALVLQSTGAALDAYNRAAADMWPAEPAVSSSSSASSGSDGPGAGAGGGAGPASPPEAVPLRCLSAVCVHGCVQLLMVMHFMPPVAVGPERPEGQPAEPHPPVVHVDLRLPAPAPPPPPPPPVQARTAPATAGASDEQQTAAAAARVRDGPGFVTDTAAIAAVQHWLEQAGGPEAAAHGTAGTPPLVACAAGASGFCWPPALQLLLRPADAGEDAGRAEAEAAVVTVLLQLPAASTCGLRSVRCVLAGPAAVEPAGADVVGSHGIAAATVHLDAELPLRILQQHSDERGGSAPVLACVRLPVPASACQAVAGLRMLHLLPPRAGSAAAGPAARPGNATSAATPGCASDSDGHAVSSAPLAVVPLLVVGSEAAAAELQQLHAEVLGPDAVAQLQQLNTAAVAGPAEAPAEAGCSSSSCAAEALSSAAAALQHSGLTSLALDFGALLQLPRSGASGGDDGYAGALGDPAAGFGELLRFLATHRMSGCLREALAALQRAGMRLLLPGAEEEQETERSAVAAAAAAASGVSSVSHEQHLQAAVDFLLLAVAPVPTPPRSLAAPAAVVDCLLQQCEPAAAAAEQGLGATVHVGRDAVASMPPPSPSVRTAAHSHGGLPGRPAPLTAAAQSAFAPAAAVGTTHEEDISRASRGSAATSCTDESLRLGSAASSVVAAFAAQQPSGSLRTRLAWWLRVLAFGFPGASPAAPAAAPQPGSSQQQAQAGRGLGSAAEQSPEAAYQAYKAASCRRLDCMSLVVYAGFRVASLVRTCAAAAGAAALPPAAAGAAGSGRLLWVLRHVLRAAAAAAPTAQRPEAAVGPPVTGFEVCSAGCPRPYAEGRGGGLTDMQLQLLAQCIFLGTGLVAIALAACTRLHQRRRNPFLRTALDAAAVLAMTLPLPRWPAPLLGVPQCWQDSNRRTGVHWMVLYGLYEPLTLQLSPYLQALQGLIFVLPMTLMEFYTYDCRWRPALRFGFGHALLALAVSAATDARSRALYLRRARIAGGSRG
ncbi:hypothetical protein HXX76_001390 [Chlamydomonas incerta]|uniref:Uncharacterized protein n=1 Tax=Chlamydomonas incerta TaxID=51695 RepID=A0A835WC58_CHLIN|nr:hypothetical protein HXX76_001390 [Chlamydomonas incerta]|eukprot:KAG2444646.1 hypothetical protein HXX76_001390 [Chlamydomonas incerta]